MSGIRRTAVRLTANVVASKPAPFCIEFDQHDLAGQRPHDDHRQEAQGKVEFETLEQRPEADERRGHDKSGNAHCGASAPGQASPVVAVAPLPSRQGLDDQFTDCGFFTGPRGLVIPLPDLLFLPVGLGKAFRSGGFGRARSRSRSM